MGENYTTTSFGGRLKGLGRFVGYYTSKAFDLLWQQFSFFLVMADNKTI